ncbi:MAG: hypothetical protein QOI11_3515 [Candidatus Eremiobacteraeota bacterium]|jgi:hypothetical protein|nr:hypothetical protein [Candidatus Eremiobacteraeota bacterium]
MERESHENSERKPGRHHGREHAAPDDEADLELEQETVPLEDIGPLPGEGAAVDDV